MNRRTRKQPATPAVEYTIQEFWGDVENFGILQEPDGPATFDEIAVAYFEAHYKPKSAAHYRMERCRSALRYIERRRTEFGKPAENGLYAIPFVYYYTAWRFYSAAPDEVLRLEPSNDLFEEMLEDSKEELADEEPT